jgi:hypothetical protein
MHKANEQIPDQLHMQDTWTPNKECILEVAAC